MLPTFVIGLREGLEAALIVGIIAAFLRKQGRTDLLRQMAVGVAAAVAICAAGGIALEIFSRDLPQRQQEGLETVIGILAVAMVTYMVVWMKQNSRGLKAQLESMAAEAIGSGRSRAASAMVAMAFLAVLREGFETVVFLLAAVNEADSGPSALIGALLGIAVAVVLGYGIYRGGVRINLSKFFRATGLVLVLVAAGLVVSALHTAHEAGWLDSGQRPLLNLTWLVHPGSVLSSLLTGMLGIQPRPVLAEVLGWLLYAIPVGLLVGWPPGRTMPMRTLRLSLVGAAAAGLGLAGVLAATAPTVASGASTTQAGATTAKVVARHEGAVVVRTQLREPLDGSVGATTDLTATSTSASTVAGVPVEVYTATTRSTGSGPAQLSTARVAALNGGRLPLGVQPQDGQIPVTYADQRVLSVGVDPQTDTVLSLSWQQTRRVLSTGTGGQTITFTKPYAVATYRLPATATHTAAAHATQVMSAQNTRADRQAWAWLAAWIGGVAAVALLATWLRRPARRVVARVADPARALIKT